MVIVRWALSIGFLVLAIFYFLWSLKHQTKYAMWAELGLWVLLALHFGLSSLSLVEPTTYLGVGVILAFLTRVILLVQRGK